MAVVATDRGQAAMEAIRRITGRMASEQESELERQVAVVHRRGRWLVALDAGGILLVLVLAGLAARGIHRTLQELRLARTGLTQANVSLGNANLRLESTVLARTADLTAANEEIQRFAYIVSHDLRSPLVNIMGFTSELETATQLLRAFIDDAALQQPGQVPADVLLAANDDLPEALRFIRASTAKMDRLVGAILKLSREGRRVLVLERLDMKQVFKGIADSLAHQAQERGAEIVIGDVPGLVGDKVAIEQVFGNIIENALKYLQPGRPGRIQISGSQNKNTVGFDIADNGRGIAERDHERIFELFRRAGDQNVPGEGIGLAHVRALVRRLGGTIACDSTIGAGSVFRIQLPAVTANNTDAAA